MFFLFHAWRTMETPLRHIHGRISSLESVDKLTDISITVDFFIYYTSKSLVLNLGPSFSILTVSELFLDSFYCWCKFVRKIFELSWGSSFSFTLGSTVFLCYNCKLSNVTCIIYFWKLYLKNISNIMKQIIIIRKNKILLLCADIKLRMSKIWQIKLELFEF